MGISAHVCLAGAFDNQTGFSSFECCEKYKCWISPRPGIRLSCQPALLVVFSADLRHYCLECLPGSFLQFRSYPYFYDLHSTLSPQFLPSQNTVGFIRISPLSPWWYIKWFRLLACCFEIPIQCLDSDTSRLWRPFIQHSLSRQSNEVEAFITFVF